MAMRVSPLVESRNRIMLARRSWRVEGECGRNSVWLPRSVVAGGVATEVAAATDAAEVGEAVAEEAVAATGARVSSRKERVRLIRSRRPTFDRGAAEKDEADRAAACTKGTRTRDTDLTTRCDSIAFVRS